MIRLILVAIVLFGFLILGIPLLLIEWVIGKFNQKWKDYSSLRLVQGAFKLIMFMTGVKLTVIGEENVPKDKAVLYVGNHRSYFDVVMTYARCPRLTGQNRNAALSALTGLDEESLLPVPGSG